MHSRNTSKSPRSSAASSAPSTSARSRTTGRAPTSPTTYAPKPDRNDRGPRCDAETQEEAVGWFARTQHLTTDLLVDVDATAGTATASWNSLMTHVHHAATLRECGEGALPVFTVGGLWQATLRRTPDGWRFSRTSVRPNWTTGEPPPLPEAATAARALEEGR
ncbi:nuclear transport factor 2 family protein [Streptomyces sp. URMC 126]|uniref:nuclear transport factor 2 family protein n=1 Tax=Streptomyces sp. URMC 126 TaxID=3423401 RepID=UPI003F1C8E39